MSSVTTTKVDTINDTTDLTLTTGNTSGPKIIVKAADYIELSNSVVNTVNATSLNLGSRLIAANGYTSLPNEFVYQFGKISSVTTSGGTINFPTTFGTVALSIQLTPTTDSRVWATSINTSACAIDVSATTDVYYTVIGY